MVTKYENTSLHPTSHCNSEQPLCPDEGPALAQGNILREASVLKASHLTNQQNQKYWSKLTTFINNNIDNNNKALLRERRTRDRKVASSNPGRSGWRIFFSKVNFVCWLLFGVLSTPVLPQWHVKDPGHSALEHAYTLDRTQ